MRKLIAAAGLALTGLAGVAVSWAEPPVSPDAVQPAPQRPSFPSGYLPRGAAPDSNVLIPPQPAAGSPALARDKAAARAALALRGTPRFEQAAIDADLFTPDAVDVFSCAAGVKLGPDTTPKVASLLRKAGPDLAMAVYPSKTRYMRPRPFMENGKPTCTPKDEPMLRRDGSYPSGHSAIGYGWGLILAEVIPDRAAQLVARGRAFGDSRRVCNVHWLSDVEEGRVVATAVLARMHAEPAFRADVEAARTEIETVLSRRQAPDCARETAALGG
ncbi:MAG: phosphatase PAP2 family protein [Novosphingobium sp.]